MAMQPVPALRPIMALLLSCVVAACSYLGPNSITTTRPDYNVAIQQTNSNELLLNLVRLRYRDPPYFMHVERVVSALEVERRLSGSVSAVQSANDTFGAAGDIRFMENPTVFYVPVVGQQFVRELMSPTQLDTLLLLTYSGWSVERVFALTLQEANQERAVCLRPHALARAGVQGFPHRPATPAGAADAQGGGDGTR